MENKKSETALIKKVGDIANVMAAAGVGFTDYITQLTYICDLCIKVTLNGIHYQGICLMA